MGAKNAQTDYQPDPAVVLFSILREAERRGDYAIAAKVAEKLAHQHNVKVVPATRNMSRAGDGGNDGR